MISGSLQVWSQCCHAVTCHAADSTFLQPSVFLDCEWTETTLHLELTTTPTQEHTDTHEKRRTYAPPQFNCAHAGARRVLDAHTLKVCVGISSCKLHHRDTN